VVREGGREGGRQGRMVYMTAVLRVYEEGKHVPEALADKDLDGGGREGGR